MRTINTITLVGYAGRDPEMRRTRGGRLYCDLPVSSTLPVRSGDSWTDQTEWIKVRMWEREADLCHRFVRRGRLLGIEGRLRVRAFLDTEGRHRKDIYVQCERLYLLGRGDGARNEEERPVDRSSERTHPAFAEAGEPEDEAIPGR